MLEGANPFAPFRGGKGLPPSRYIAVFADRCANCDKQVNVTTLNQDLTRPAFPRFSAVFPLFPQNQLIHG